MPVTGLLRDILSGLIALVLLPWAVAQRGGQTGGGTDGGGVSDRNQAKGSRKN